MTLSTVPARMPLVAGAHAMRKYVNEHACRYAAGNAAQVTGPDDPLVPAANRVIASWAAMLHGYQLEPDQEIHALRMLRSSLHGFTTLEAAGSFQLSADIDESFTWMLNFMDHGVKANHPNPLAAR